MGTAGAAGAAAAGASGGCTPAPTGTFMTMTVPRTGPDGNYTIYRPTTLGENGFVHPPVAWGNGLGTVPSQYDALLNNVASHGFVVIANPGPGSNPMVVQQGLDWLLEQNSSGDYAGKLAVTCAATIGYSMGGGAAVGAGSDGAVKAVVSIHGLPDASQNAKGPILLTTSDDDSFVPATSYVQPCYDRSTVQPTIMATYVTGKPQSFEGHLTPLGDGGQDADPMIAWLRLWLYGDQDQRKWFFGADCTLCTSPWSIQSKNYDWGR
jgi:Dienelactone hydrolase family